MIRALALFTLALPTTALAEGARLTLTCEVQRSCNEAGACDPFGGTQVFTLAPTATDANGTGDWTVALNDGEATPARGLAHTGPWVWQPGDGHLHTLSLTGEASALRIRQWLPTERYPETYAEIDIMTCEVTG
ncbi:hypothetical protein FHY55_10845 [Oceanicola sp. D3]|uniref:hypothetical protein n=1 Tax=Oceanicola sp. D3 TaxID=2587163 RepID=UPI00111E1701|nr:hypothetical protein [Oceanicola sp. D3]QDC09711.1 hypothetical protein FHY55_10845 [Oceanicola sp. D3]